MGDFSSVKVLSYFGDRVVGRCTKPRGVKAVMLNIDSIDTPWGKARATREEGDVLVVQLNVPEKKSMESPPQS